MANGGHTGLKRVWHAGINSLRGLGETWKNEAAFRQECWLAIPLVFVAFWFGDSGVEKAIMLMSVALVLVVEILNSAIESVVDRIGLERHELSGRAKDQGSAAVSLCLLLCFVVYALCLLD